MENAHNENVNGNNTGGNVTHNCFSPKCIRLPSALHMDLSLESISKLFSFNNCDNINIIVNMNK